MRSLKTLPEIGQVCHVRYGEIGYFRSLTGTFDGRGTSPSGEVFWVFTPHGRGRRELRLPHHIPEGMIVSMEVEA